MNYSVILVIGAILNLVAGTMLVAVFHNNLGFLGLIASSMFMAIVFIKDVVLDKEI